MKAEDLSKVTFNESGWITLYYGGTSQPPIELTPHQVSESPMNRIPIFNVLKSDSKFKPVIEKWLWDELKWKITFNVKGDIDAQAEEKAWQRNLGLPKFRPVTSGQKTRR